MASLYSSMQSLGRALDELKLANPGGYISIHHGNREHCFIKDFSKSRCQHRAGYKDQCSGASNGATYCSWHSYVADVIPRLTTVCLCLRERGMWDIFSSNKQLLIDCLFER